MVLTKEEYKGRIEGRDITDCVVRNKEFFHFIAMDRKTGNSDAAYLETNVIKYEIGIYLDSEVGKRCSRSEFTGWDYLFVGATKTDEVNEVVLVDWGGNVYARGCGANKMEKKIPSTMRKGVIKRIRMIGGRLYVVGDLNTACYRKGIDKWESLKLNVHLPAARGFGFNSKQYEIVDMDGYSFNELYAISRKDFIWHFNGAEWEKIQFPSNIYLDCVCCAGDGNVYISGMNGTIFKGQRNDWKEIHKGDMELPFQDIVWHAGKVWCTNQYDLWTIEDDRLTQVDLDEKMKVCTGHLSVGDGVMLAAGKYGAAYHDGETWHLLFNTKEFGDTGGWE